MAIMELSKTARFKNMRPTMGELVALSLVLLWCTSAAFAKLGTPGGPLKLKRPQMDYLEVFASIPYAEVIASSEDPTFECMLAILTEIDPQAGTATYLWIFPSTGENASLHIRAPDESGIAIFTIDNECILFASRKLKGSVPERCIRPFTDTCGGVAPQNSGDICPDGDMDD
ncbi:uncharacterized protein LOC119384944 [Rhipicephalus sanguineus]|uniref:uncharacterized protein LOC119384944 n=1 Tax=Rhipicephalus sanguineus TaxID=34632 RepID=UPI0018949757|nr:uncharacterized protein LOC119384944 [Rhipicephalus sanguineus]